MQIKTNSGHIWDDHEDHEDIMNYIKVSVELCVQQKYDHYEISNYIFSVVLDEYGEKDKESIMKIIKQAL